MSHIRLEKRKIILERRKIWDEHKDTLLPGQYIFILQDRVKKAGWKLRQIYDKDLYFILKVSKTYLFCIKVGDMGHAVKDPFHPGKIYKQHIRRVHVSRVKLCVNPLKYLGLENSQKHFEAAADLLGSEEINNEILVVGKPTTQQISHPPFQNAKETIFENSGLSKICDAILRQKLCVPFTSDCLIRSFEKNEAIAMYSNHNWTYLQSRLEDKVPSDGISLNNTCEHGFTEKYRLYKENLLKRKLKMIDDNDDHDQNDHCDKNNHQKSRHHRQQDGQRPPPVRENDQKIKLERFMNDMQRYLITIKKEDFPEKCIQNLRKYLDDNDQDSDGETWAPPRPPPSTGTWSSASSIRTTSSPFFNDHGENADDHEDQSSSLSLHSAIISSTEDEVQNNEDRDIIFDASTDDHSNDNDHHRPLSSTPKTPKYHFQDDDLDVTLIQDREKPKKSRKSKSKLTSVKKALSKNDSLAQLFDSGSPSLRSPGEAGGHLGSASELSTVESSRRKLRLRAKK